MVESETATMYVFGYGVYYDYECDVWRFVDTTEPVSEETTKTRACPKCKKYITEDGQDPCIRDLPGVRNACCGHGVVQGYAQLTNGTIIRGQFEFDD